MSVNRNRRFKKYSEWLASQKPDITKMPVDDLAIKIAMSAPQGKLIDLRYIRDAVKKIS